MPAAVDLRFGDATSRGGEGEPDAALMGTNSEFIEPEAIVGVRGYLPRRPWLARDGRGRPVLALTVVLTRRPGPELRDVLSLIERGQLSFDATLELPPEALGTSTAAPAFARSALFRLTTQADKVEMARAVSSGPGARAALTAALDARQTRAVIDALSKLESGMNLSVDLVADGEPIRSRVSFNAKWAALYDAIALQAAGAPDFDISTIERSLQQLQASGGLDARTLPANIAAPEVLAAAIRGFVRSGGMILARAPGAGPGRYRLTERPPEEFVWTYDETLSSPMAIDVSIAAPLERVLGGALDGQDWSAFVRLVAPDGPEGGYSAVPRLSRGEMERSARDEGGTPISSMVLVNATIVDSAAVTATSRPSVRPAALSSGMVKQMWLADGVLDYLGKRRVRSLPVTTGGGEVLFPDRLDGTRRWYLPALEVVEPNPAESPDTAAFLFSFERIGTGSTGDAALSGTLRLTLRPTVPEAVRTALATLNNPPAQPIEMLDLSVDLSIPFVDSADNVRKRTTLRGTTDRSGADIVATFTVADQWVRLVYGVLSLAGFQNEESATIGYSFRYESYRAANGSTIRPVNGLKQAMIPLDWSPKATAARPLVFDAKAGVLMSGSTHIRFGSEDIAAPSAVRLERAGGLAAMARPASAAITRPIALASPAATVLRPNDGIAARPLPLKIRPSLIDIIPQLQARVYVQQSVGVQGAADVLMPCNSFGPLYGQRLATGWQSIGCQDAFRLGTAPAQLYEEITALAGSWFRVYRCLPQPERFLVLPRTYRIARYPTEHDRAYFPAAMVYATLDPETVANNRYRFVATVEPDIPAFALRALCASLSAYAPPASIQIDLPTDVALEVDLPAMPLASAIAPPRFTVTGKGVQVVLECQLADALILRSAIEVGGVLGRLAFTFGDSSRLESDIEILLSQIVGPWGTGPVSADRSAGHIRLTNRVDRSVDVSVLRLYAGVAAATELTVGRRLEAFADAQVAVDDAESEISIVYSFPPGGPRSLEECRVYMEDVSTNVIFTCGINFEARGIADIEVYARLRGEGAEQRVSLSTNLPRVGTAHFTAPLSSVLGATENSPGIEYRLVRVMTSGERVEKAWASCPGAVVDIQWDLLA